MLQTVFLPKEMPRLGTELWGRVLALPGMYKTLSSISNTWKGESKRIMFEDSLAMQRVPGKPWLHLPCLKNKQTTLIHNQLILEGTKNIHRRKDSLPNKWCWENWKYKCNRSNLIPISYSIQNCINCQVKESIPRDYTEN